MIRALALFVWLVPSTALAQSAPQHPANDGTAEQTMRRHTTGTSVPTQPGQAAFAAIQEIVGILEADPKTDWSKVNIEALRRHLIDMNNVTLAAVVAGEPVEGGMRYTVTGSGAVRDSIRRMVMAHAATMDGADGWRFEASATESGAILTVLPPADKIRVLRGLGFIGVMTRGVHHQGHHLTLARGESPHR